MRPDLVGPVVLAGAPLSYWGGVRGKNPMRYTGGLLGGTWMARLMSDLGGGIFDGAWLISNFDNLNPANTLWTKQYNVWAKPEKEEDRYLEFEKWWGAFVRLRGEELQYMVDNLFVGNKLSTAQIVTQDGIRLDIRNIKSPILCFCSKGDNITPPQQALDWILDNYDSVDEIRKHGQTILYCLHETAGHLAIFVGTKVAAKEHSEFINYMDLIDGIPPGLYEIVITDKSEGEVGAELLAGRLQRADRGTRPRGHPGPGLQQHRGRAGVRGGRPRLGAQQRVVLDLRSALAEAHGHAADGLGGAGDAAVAPQVCAVLGQEPDDASGGAAGREGPRRAQDAGRRQPLLESAGTGLGNDDGMARSLRSAPRSNAGGHVPCGLWLALVPGLAGRDAQRRRPRPKPGTSPDQKAALAAKIEELRTTMDQGGPLEAAVRALVYIALGQRSVDARSFEVLRRILEGVPRDHAWLATRRSSASSGPC